MRAGTAEITVFPKQTKLLLISVNKTVENPKLTLYDAVRYSWKVSAPKAAGAKYVLAVVHGVVEGVFEADEWLPAEKANFPDVSDEHGNWNNQRSRFGFRGREAPSDIQGRYRGKRIPDDFRHKGNPVRYINF